MRVKLSARTHLIDVTFEIGDDLRSPLLLLPLAGRKPKETEIGEGYGKVGY
jgi:hypothetical protein